MIDSNVRIQGYGNVQDFALSTTDSPQGLPVDVLYEDGLAIRDFDKIVKRVVIRVENASIRIGFGNIAPDQAGNGFPVNVDETFVFSSFAEAKAAQIASADAGSSAKVSIIAYY